MANPHQIYAINEDLLNVKFFTYRVSLPDAERLSKISSINNSFCKLLKSSSSLCCMVQNFGPPDVFFAKA